MRFVRKGNASVDPLGRIVGILICLAMTGCGNNLAQVTGTVTVDGQTLASGPDMNITILFQPEGGGANGIALVDSTGQYTVATGSEPGIAPGEYLVTCSATQLVPSKTPGGAPGGKRISDSKYANAQTSGLRVSVKEGHNQYDIPLESPKTAARK